MHQEAGLPVENDSFTDNMPPASQNEQGTRSAKEIMSNGNGHVDGSDLRKLDIVVNEDTSSEDEASSSLEWELQL